MTTPSNDEIAIVIDAALREEVQYLTDKTVDVIVEALKERYNITEKPEEERRRFYTIRESDVGRNITAWGRTWKSEDFIGKIQRRDVGKRVYRVVDHGATLAADDYVPRYILQVENDEQFQRRVAS